MFYLTIVNKILRHCHSWLAQQYDWCAQDVEPNEMSHNTASHRYLSLLGSHDKIEPIRAC